MLSCPVKLKNFINKPIKGTKSMKCRICQSSNLEKFLSLGETPLANSFLKKEELDNKESRFPLEICLCNNCKLVQLSHVVPAEFMFKNYVYVSSTSNTFKLHFAEIAEYISKEFKLNSDSLVVDIGSNDGILLKPFKDFGVQVLGIEPAVHIANIARKNGIDTRAEFFSPELAARIVKDKGKAKIVTGTNVFAHIDDLDKVISGVKELLEDDGVFITESPYLVDFIQKRYFDLVYHEHLSYWAVSPLITLFKRFDISVVDVQKVNVHGGSIQVFAMKNGKNIKIKKSVKEFLNLEKKMQLANSDTYINFAKKVLENKMKLISLLTKLRLSGKIIVGYGAPAKGNTLLNYFKIGPEIIDYIVDDSPFKQGLYTPGTHIPVVSPDKIFKDKPDYILILAWNFADSIIKKLGDYKKGGGKFIIPVPRPYIV